MTSMWWVAAAFFIGSYAGAVLVALISMARNMEDNEAACCAHEPSASPPAPSRFDRAAAAGRTRRHTFMLGCAAVLLFGTAAVAGYVGAGYYAGTHDAADDRVGAMPMALLRPVVTRQVVATTSSRAAAPSVAIAPAGKSPTLSFRDAVARATPSVVTVISMRATDEAATDAIVLGLGSGVVLDRDGFIVTSSHVIADASDVMVTLSDGVARRVRLVGSDLGSDLALLKLDGEELQAIEMSDLQTVAVGDVVLAVGNPLGFGETVTQGIVSAIHRVGPVSAAAGGFIQTDAAINPGSSGGALIDTSGRLVGINSSILSRSGGFEGIGFAVPVDVVRMVAASLRIKDRVANAPPAAAFR